MQLERIKYLTGKFINGTQSPDEKNELAAWLNDHPEDTQITEVLEHAWNQFEPDEKMPDDTSDRIIVHLFGNDRQPGSPDAGENRPAVWLWSKIAAAVVLVLGLGWYWWGGQQDAKLAKAPDTQSDFRDLPPGGNKAVLTLGDGSSIVLDNAGNGNLAQQGGTDIIKSGSGELVYNSGKTRGSAPVFNTIETPKGGQYHVVLSDGTGVWLNAASSLRFPTVFTGTERRVEIKGEVYFEVAHNKQMPFIVKAAETEIAVLGTHFNVMAYSNETVMRTTLLEGSVKVSRDGFSAMLTPGQQARMRVTSGSIEVLKDVDTEKELSWKNGYFQFEDENLESIMRQVSRWYDVEVAYEGNTSSERFTGRLPRNSNVSKLLKILSLSGVKFRIEDKTIIVTP
ncbi:FecR domain-containing protein [Dyadobacter bucti]|uniref:FecR domain-containing protein n=1 Tax=Dyadobacter bucti TaxID=2572203 RepID=UPI003F70CCD6